ncbi:MAG TPA: hypothetical protein PK826_03180 [Anaerolineae bacterium]|jgi:hypothetical protein|nr:hypothetical protein [Ardenticatenia bacterium]MBK8539878.1 hypothetical protein [Ardenticatenia bacterium]HQZ70320.1 hypothetical protein [Anaerolineae bacterium]
MKARSVVDTAHVRSALRQLARHCSPTRNPLADLACVRLAARRSGFEPTLEAREFELGRMLGETVATELERLRRQTGAGGGGAPRDLRHWPIAARICADFEKDHPELEAWSGIYHLYLRPDLNLSLIDLIAMVPGRCRRTVQRRLQRGIQALTERMLVAEHEARQHPAAVAWSKPTRWEDPSWDDCEILAVAEDRLGAG